MRESEIIEQLRAAADNPAARGLLDDAAVWMPPLGRELVLTHDTIAAGVHYLAQDNPSDIAWKLVAVNLSDLAAKGARPAGILISLSLSAEDKTWIAGFASGLNRVLTEHGVELWGGDTVRAPATVLGCTAIGHIEPGQALSRAGAGAGHDLWVSGCIGDAGLGLKAQRGDAPPDKYLQRRYRLPMPRLALGAQLAKAGASAVMDVSDGLLVDARRMAGASRLGLSIELEQVPISPAAAARLPTGAEGAIAAATAGDDYELLIAASKAAAPALQQAAAETRTPLTRVGGFALSEGIAVTYAGKPVALPDRLGFEH